MAHLTLFLKSSDIIDILYSRGPLCRNASIFFNFFMNDSIRDMISRLNFVPEPVLSTARAVLDFQVPDELAPS